MQKWNEAFSSDKKNRRILLILALLGFGGLGLLLNVTYITDETGTMANAAFLAGFDWSKFIEFTGGYYYKYGQVLFWYPLFSLIKSPVVIYKLIMLENAVLLALAGQCFYQILRKHLNVREPQQAFWISLAVSITPAAVLYSLFARADVILVTFSIFVLYFMLEGWSKRENGKKLAWYSFLTAFFSVYIFSCHARGVVWMIAVTMVVLGIHFLTKQKMVNYWVYFSTLICSLILDQILTAYFKINIWGDKIKHNESLDFEKLKDVFTADGMKTMIKLGMGWLFNFMTSSMGLAVAGVFVSVIIIWLFIRKKKEITPQEAIMSAYGFLVFAGSMALGMLFFFGYAYDLYYGLSEARLDRLVYDRYLAGALQPAVLLAVYFFIYRKDILKKASRIVLGGICLALLVFYKIFIGWHLNQKEFSIRNSIASNLFVDTGRLANDAGKYENMSGGLLYGAVFACVILFLFLLFSYLNKKESLQYGLFVVFFLSLAVNYAKMRGACDWNVYRKVYDINRFMGKIRDVSDVYPYLYVDKTAARYKPLQLICKEFEIYHRGHKPEEDMDDYLIISDKNKYNKELYEEDYYLFDDFDYENADFYVVYVKGEELKSELEKRGINLSKLNLP